MNRVRVILSCFALIAAFAVGYSVSENHWEQEVTEAKLAYETKAKRIESEYREKERRAAESLVQAFNARDRAIGDADALRSSADRVRYERDEARRRLSEATSDSCKRERERLSAGAEIISRGADLVERYDRLAKKSVADKDFVVKVHEAQ